MSYKLIIADDKGIILDGFTKLIDWKEIGYEIVGSFGNGQEVIEFIKDNEVDVILTDIKMPISSGIDVAKYVHTRNLPITVVLISAFKDFMLAREAMRYNVKHYLLKPTKLEEIRSVFGEIKQQLDLDKKNEIEQQDIYEDAEIKDIMQRQFFADLFWGILHEPEQVNKRKNDAGFDTEVPDNTFAFFSIEYEYNEDNNQQKIKDYFNKPIQSIYQGSKLIGKIFLICSGNSSVYYSAAFEPDITFDEIEQIVLGNYRHQTEEFRLLFGHEMKIQINHLYKNVWSYLDEINNNKSNSGYDYTKVSIIPPQYENIAIDEYIRQIALYINELETEFALQIFRKLMERYLEMPNGGVRIFLTGLLIHIIDNTGNKFSQSDHDVKTRFFSIDKKDDLIKNAEEFIKDLVYEKKNNLKQSQNIIIQEAKDYINQNFSADIGLEGVSRYVFLSPTYFSRLFKQEMDINFTEYVKQIRINKAIELMGQIQYKIYDVSRMVGYDNIRYFYKVFKQITGFTPTEYRNKHWKDADLL